MFWKAPLSVGTTVYVIDEISASVSSWKISEVTSAGHSCIYRLIKSDGSSFCLFESSRLGKDYYIKREQAIKELERRINDPREKIHKKI